MRITLELKKTILGVLQEAGRRPAPPGVRAGPRRAHVARHRGGNEGAGVRKPNVQSPLDRLEDAKQHKLYELLKGASYEEVLPKVRAEFGVRTTVSSLSRFMKRRAVVEHLRESVYASEAFAESEDVKALDKRKRSAVVSAMWEALTAKDTKSIVALGRLLVSMDAGRRDDDALRLAREKFEASERRASAAKNALGDTKLTDADKIARMKEIFG